jgi:hypothetical protein
MSNRYVCIGVLAALVMGASTGVFADDSQKDAMDRSMKAELTATGIDYTNPSQLIQQMHSPKKPGLAPWAAYAISQLPKTDTAVTELSLASRSGDETLAAYAIDALVSLQETKWGPDGTALLYRMKGPLRFQVAGRLAQIGVYDGWPMIQQAALDPKYSAFNAMRQIPYFVGMRDAHNNPVDLVQELHKLYLAAPLQNRRDIAVAMGMITYKATPFKPASVSKP